MKNNKRVKNLLSGMVGSGFLLILIGIVLSINTINQVEDTNAFKYQDNNSIKNSTRAKSTTEKEFIYLSDIPYIKEQSSVGWGSITLDANLDAKVNNGLITLIINGNQKQFLKGVTAHATSTLMYDISSLNFDYFSTYYGVDAGRGSNGNGVKFAIYTSIDGKNWDLHTPVSPAVKKGNSEAEKINIDIKGKKYLKLYCHNNGNDGSDHCTYGNAKFYKEGYIESNDDKPYSFIKTLEEYDETIRNSSQEELVTTKEQILLQRKFVSNIGYDLLQSYAHLNEDRKQTIEWIMTDQDALRYYITGGKPIGSYMNSINVLNKLYTTYKNDLKETTRTNYTVLGDLYKRMIISLSLTHSTNVCLWVGGNQCSDPVTRYAIYKKMRAEEKLVNKVFETLNIEEMRWVMNNNIDDEEIEWLNHHIRRFPTNTMPYNIDPYRYITYRFGYNYNLPQYYSQENYASWDQKYHLTDYHITYQAGKPKLWIVFEQGSVCGGLSKTGSNINGSLGNPSAVIGQPGHAAYLEYSETTDGKGMWSIKNDVGGWTVAEKGERMLAGWGSNNWDSYYQVSYTPYTQEALNDIENYNKALETMLLADLYQDDVEKLEEIYEKALEYQPINMDAWYGLIRTYQRNSDKTAEDYIKLAKKLSDNMYYFPLPMSDLMNLMKGNLDNTMYAATFTNYLRMNLEKGTQLGTTIQTDILQPAISRVMANYLLGRNDYSIANFSFDGENANKIMLGSRYEGNGVRWEYSLDNGITWNATSESEVLLSDEEIESITAENDIKIHIVGVDYSEANIYTIDITNAALPTTLYANDLENRVVGVDLTYEWRYIGTDAWRSYKNESPNLTGDKTVQIRVGANGKKLPSSIVTYTFTEDNQPNTRKYIPVSHLSVHAVSTQATNNGGAAAYAIDGNYNTRWHSAWNGTDTERFITIKLDKPVFLSAVEFVPAGGGNGKIYDGTIYGSLDGEDWDILSQKKGLTYSNQANTNDQAIANTKSFDIEEPQEVQYVKIVADRTNGNWIAARAFNFYQDLTYDEHPTAGVAFNTTEPTNQNVVARLVNPSTNITITNNDGSDTYTFTENGEFTFRFVDDEGRKGTAKAKVKWIDKVAPTATIEYSTTKETNKEVIATLKPSEEVTMLNNKNYSINEDGEILDIYGNVLEGFTVDDEGFVKDPNGNTIANMNPFRREFTKNGKFTFEFVDKAGNKGTATAQVDWIIEELPIEPEKPTNPEKPTEPEKPTNPEKPIEPEKPTKPTENTNTSNIKNQNNKSNSTKNSKNIISKTTNNGNTKSTNKAITELKIEFVKLQIPSNILNGKGTLKYKQIESKSGYDCFELSLKNASLKNNNQKMKMIIDLKNNKKVANVYYMDEKGNLKKLNYNQMKDNSIEVEINKLGKFVITYQNQAKREVENDKETKKVTNAIYAIIIAAIIAMISLTIIAVKGTKKQIK